MALNDSCHLLIATKHHFIQKSGGGGLQQNLGGGLELLSPIASAATAGSLGVIFGKLQEYFAPTTSVNSIYITYTKYRFYRATPVRLSVTRRYCV